MATEKELYEIVGQAMCDEEFRKALIADPAKVAQGLGVSLTEQQLAALKATDFAHVAEGVDQRLSKFSRIGI